MVPATLVISQSTSPPDELVGAARPFVAKRVENATVAKIAVMLGNERSKSRSVSGRPAADEESSEYWLYRHL